MFYLMKVEVFIIAPRLRGSIPKTKKIPACYLLELDCTTTFKQYNIYTEEVRNAVISRNVHHLLQLLKRAILVNQARERANKWTQLNVH